ncbi:hypothetical protein MMC16_003017 [Acarospora aff. strigata]|nr:hypothetical protein [Acarospora aff. strigata]
MAAKMTWDGAADQHLLLSILTTHDVKVDFDVVAANLGCTPRAVQERLKKLKKIAAEQKDADPNAPKTPTKTKAVITENGDATTPTPKKRKVATPKSTTPKSSTPKKSATAAKDKKEGRAQKIKAEKLYEADGGVTAEPHAEEDYDLGGYEMDPDIDEMVKEEQILQNGEDPVLYDAQTAHLGGTF